MGQAVAEMELAQPILQRIYAFPDTATKPAWLRPSGKYIPSRMWHGAQGRLGAGKTARNMKDATARKFSPIQTPCTQTPFTYKSTERGYRLTPYPLGVCTPCERQITAAKDVPSLCAFGRWTIYGTPKRSNHAITAPPKDSSPRRRSASRNTAESFVCRRRAIGAADGRRALSAFEANHPHSQMRVKSAKPLLKMRLKHYAHLLHRKRRSISPSAQSRP